MYGNNTFWKIRKKNGMAFSAEILDEDNISIKIIDRDNKEYIINKSEIDSSFKINKEIYLKEVNSKRGVNYG